MYHSLKHSNTKEIREILFSKPTKRENDEYTSIWTSKEESKPQISYNDFTDTTPLQNPGER